MIFSRDYSRAILNLKQEDSSAEPSGIFGRVVIEIKSGKGELMLYAKGIEKTSAGSLYLVCQREDRFIPLKAVLVNINEGSAAVKWRFNPDNLSGSGFKIEEVKVIAIISEKGESLLSTFCGKPVKWRTAEVMSAELPPEASKKPVSERAAPNIRQEAKQKKEALSKPEKALKTASAEEPSKKEAAPAPDERVLKFTEAVNRFRKDLDELRYYAYMEKTENDEKRQTEQGCCLDLDSLFRKRPEYVFEGCEGYFVKIKLNDLCLIDDYMYKYANNPTVRRAYRRYGHFLLGKTEDELIFCVPDENRRLNCAEKLGFADFKETDGAMGYRIMKLAKEKKYENPKEKLDGGGA